MLLALSLLTWLRCAVSGSPSASSAESAAERETAFAKYPDALYPVRKRDKWGYINRRGDMVIQPMFADAGDFFHDRAVASIEKDGAVLYGYIVKKGQWVIEPAYTRADPFYENRAAVSKGDNYGFIDPAGNEVIPLQFQSAGRFTEGLAAVKQNGWVGIIDTTGKMVVQPKFTCSVQHPVFVNGMAPAFGADEMTGYINATGEWVIEPRFHSAARFSENKAWAMLKEDDANAQYGFRIRGGYINREGEFIIEPEYDFGWDFFEGHATVSKLNDTRTQKLWYVIDSAGNKVLSELPYRNVGSITEGLIPVQNEAMEWGFINLQGEEVIQPQYTGINRFMNGLARMETGSAFSPKPIYINTKGQVVWRE